jgi:hypothetical protein
MRWRNVIQAETQHDNMAILPRLDWGDRRLDRGEISPSEALREMAGKTSAAEQQRYLREARVSCPQNR